MGNGLRPLLALPEVGTVPTALIAGDIGPLTTGLVRAITFVNTFCSAGDPVASRFTAAKYATIFDPDVWRVNPSTGIGSGSTNPTDSDGSVPQSSALAGHLPREGLVFVNRTHSPGISLLLGPVFISADHLQDGSSEVISYVTDLLNTGVDSPRFVKK